MTTTPTQEIAATLEWLRTTGQDAINKAFLLYGKGYEITKETT